MRLVNLAMMVGVVGLLGGLAYLDEQRESAAALADLGREEATLAPSLAEQIATDLPRDLPAARSRLRAAEHENERVVLLLPPSAGSFLTPDGREITSPALANAANASPSFAKLTRPEAAELGLPARTAMVGIAHVSVGGARWTIVSAASAERQRDRENRARARFYLGVIASSFVVALFGGIALRQQHQAQELARALAQSRAEATREERLAKADRAAVLGTLAMGIAHEVGTPLSIIAGRAEQLRAQLPDDRTRQSAETIATQADRIHRVITAFLALARGEQPAASTLTAEEIIDGATQLAAHVFAKAGVRLKRGPIAAARLHGDRALLEQALVNLLVNACHAASETVTAGAETRADSIFFFVDDDGPGIDGAISARVTEPFFTTKAPGQGSGLGLAIAAEIVKSHRGELALTPRTPNGTRASITLPESK